jgi:hypothetical protein
MQTRGFKPVLPGFIAEEAALYRTTESYRMAGTSMTVAGGTGVVPQFCVNSPCLGLPSGTFCINLPILGRRCVTIPNFGSWRVRCCTGPWYAPWRISCGVQSCG